MKRLVRPIVRSRNPILRPPEGRSLRDASSLDGTQKQNDFSGATALFRVPSGLFFHIFSVKTEKIWPPEAVSLAGKKAGLNNINGSLPLNQLPVPDEHDLPQLREPVGLAAGDEHLPGADLIEHEVLPLGVQL